MKKLAILLFGIIAIATSAHAQLEIMPFSGYTFGDKFAGNSAKIEGGANYGVVVSYPIQTILNVEFTYNGQAGRFDNNIRSRNSTSYAMTSNYFLLGLSKNIPVMNKLTTFAGWGAGVANYNIDFKGAETFTQFGMEFKVGAKYWITEKFGIFIQGKADFPIADVDANLWLTWDLDVDGGLSTSVPFTQFAVNGGLVFRL